MARKTKAKAKKKAAPDIIERIARIAWTAEREIEIADGYPNYRDAGDVKAWTHMSEREREPYREEIREIVDENGDGRPIVKAIAAAIMNDG